MKTRTKNHRINVAEETRTQSQYGARRFADRCAFRARSFATTKLKPGGHITPYNIDIFVAWISFSIWFYSPFCEAPSATSMFHRSNSSSIVPSDATASTMYSALWFASRIARPIAGMSLTTPDAVSICTHRIALMAPSLSCFNRSSTATGSTARSHSPNRFFSI
jgi:hypothetical protein